jgi:hypothetical protein
MKGKKLSSSHEKDAKMKVLSHLRDMAQESMGHKLGGLKKVSVMSDSSEGLEKGLSKAQELTKEHLENEDAQMAPEMMDTSPHRESEDRYENLEEELGGIDEESEEMSSEDIDAKIAHLQSLKNSMRKG